MTYFAPAVTCFAPAVTCFAPAVNLFLPAEVTISVGICETLGAERNGWTVHGASSGMDRRRCMTVVLCKQRSVVASQIVRLWRLWVEEKSTRWTR